MPVQVPVQVPVEVALLILDYLRHPCYTLCISGLYRGVGQYNNTAWSSLAALRRVCRGFNSAWLMCLRQIDLKLRFCDVVFAVPWAFSRIRSEVQERVFDVHVDVNGRVRPGTEFSDAVHFALQLVPTCARLQRLTVNASCGVSPFGPEFDRITTRIFGRPLGLTSGGYTWDCKFQQETLGQQDMPGQQETLEQQKMPGQQETLGEQRETLDQVVSTAYPLLRAQHADIGSLRRGAYQSMTIQSRRYKSQGIE